MAPASHILRVVFAARQRLVPIVALLAVLLAGCGGDDAEQAGSAEALAAQRAAGHALFWAGESFDGLPLRAVTRTADRTTFAYGSCKPPVGEGGCAPPLQIQSASLCDDNALKVALLPVGSFAARGTTVRDYGEGRLDLDASTSLVRIFGSGERGRRAVEALRPVSASASVPARLPAARYPNHYLEQLRRVRDAYARSDSLRTVRRELGISVSAARLRLGLAGELGPARLSSARGVACDHPPG